MLYTASYFEPEHWHGQIYSISRSKPKDIWVDGEIDLFKPSAALLKWWKDSAQDGAARKQYSTQFFAELDPDGVKSWLSQFDRLKHQELDKTLLCWEKAGDFCHRNLVAMVIQKHTPWAIGGTDVRQIQVGDLVEWPVQEGGNLDWLRPFQVRSIDGAIARLSWIDGDVPISQLRLQCGAK